MIPQTKIEQSAEKCAETYSDGTYEIEQSILLGFRYGVRFAESEIGKAQTFEIDFCGHVKAKLEFKDGKVSVIASMNGYGEPLNHDRITITKPTHENES